VKSRTVKSGEEQKEVKMRSTETIQGNSSVQ